MKTTDVIKYFRLPSNGQYDILGRIFKSVPNGRPGVQLFFVKSDPNEADFRFSLSDEIDHSGFPIDLSKFIDFICLMREITERSRWRIFDYMGLFERFGDQISWKENLIKIVVKNGRIYLECVLYDLHQGNHKIDEDKIKKNLPKSIDLIEEKIEVDMNLIDSWIKIIFT
jgi:hypothetical protein